MPTHPPTHPPIGASLGTPLSPATPTGRAPVVPLGRAWATLAVLAFSAFIIVTGEMLPLGLITHIAGNLDHSVAEIGRTVTAYALVVAAVSVPLAHITRSIPRRHLLTAAMLVHAAGLTVTVLAPGFGGFLAGRTLTAFAQALFWAIVSGTAAGLFPSAMRGRVIARLFLGPTAAVVIGLPSATWLGQRAGWHTPFLVLACLGAAAAVVIALLLPHYKPADGAAARGSHPSRRRFLTLLIITMLAMLGFATAFTYVAPYLRDVSGFADSSLPILFTANGIAGIFAAMILARYLDRSPRGMIAVGVGTVGIGWASVGAFGTVTTTRAR